MKTLSWMGEGNVNGAPGMSETADEHKLTGLPPGAARLGEVLARPVPIALACLVLLAGIGWLYLVLMVAAWAGHAPAASLGPGMGLFDLITQRAGHDLIGRALIDVLCRPSFGTPGAGMRPGPAALVLLMWVAMTLAMMLPTAAGMIVTYAQIADTAARKGERAVSPLVLTGGYVAVWLGFAFAAAVLQLALTRAALLDHAMASASPLLSGAIFIAAGAYQFTELKRACLTRCQRPFPFFFANWSDAPSAIFRLGLRQGIHCLGCCWALMLAMFAVGVMNVVWMAALGLIMTAEKLTTTTRFSRGIGLVFIAIGITFVALSAAARWPHAPALP
jgi:predicted metal-binding membrane protein